MRKIVLILTICASTLSALATTYYVKPDGNNNNDGKSWSNAKKTITSAISSSTTGDEIRVAQGTYNERIGGLKDGVAILGGYNAATGERDIDQYKTIIDGTGITKTMMVKYDAAPTSHILLEGFTMQNASSESSSGPAIYMRGNMTLNRCHIINCHATGTSSAPGALYIDQSGAAVQAVVSNCVIELCSGYSTGAIYNKGGLIENCIIRGCTGSTLIIRNSAGVIRNCLIHNNTTTVANANGAFYNENGTFSNNTICNNYAGGYVAYTNSSGVANNCVFWGNKAADGFTSAVNYISSSSSSSNNVADEGTSSTKFLSFALAANNYDAAGPNFGNPTAFVGAPTSDAEITAMQNADFSLTATSTALLNKGTSTNAPSTDINGTARPIGSGIDLGCYEYNPNAASVALQGIQILQDTLYVSIGASGAFAVIYTPGNATNKQLNWTIDNTSIATINGGLVTGVAVGKTKAHATSVEGGFTDEAVVVIRPKAYPHEVLDADANYHIEDYTVPTFIEFLVAKENARIDSFTCKDMSIITEKLAIFAEKKANLKSKYEPYNMIANFNGDPKTHMAFCWFTNGGVTNGKVQLVAKANATASDFSGSNVIEINATATTTAPLHYTPIQPTESPKYDICTAAGLPRDQYFTYVSHKAQAENLTPGTTYSWRVGYSGHWSEIGQFKTKDANQGDFSFIYMSDSHIQDYEYVENARWCSEAAVKNEKNVSFCVFPGDFVDTGGETNSEWQWERWFEESTKPVIMNMPLVVTDGNHDDSELDNYDYHFNTDWGFYNGAQTKPQFKGITYSFVYGDVLFLVYSLQDWWRAKGSSDKKMVSSYITTDIRNWFKDQIAAHPNTKYRVTLAHKTIFSGAGHHVDDETPLLRELMLPILKECQIDLAIQGHDHCYEIIGPVNPDTRTVVSGAVSGVQTVSSGGENANMTGKTGGTFTTDEGTVYFVGATCGRKRYSPRTRAKLEEEYTTDASILFDGKHHNVANYFDLFTSMFGQPGAPSYSRFNVSSNGIEIKSYKTDEYGNSTLYNTVNIVNSKQPSVATGLENTKADFRGGEKIIRDGQLYIRIDGETYNVFGQKVE
ncbi:MAG: fibronectin type III domain-containing protein [Paludibacteraceae bacterium]|nr:fibronectin type III domain-containing protein [Paludibacteraceae bacterium]